MMPTPEVMNEILREIDVAIDHVSNWREEFKTDSLPDKAHAYIGDADSWMLTVVSLRCDDQEVVNYDGAASQLARGLVLRLPQNLAERAARRACVRLGVCKRCGEKLAYPAAIYCGAGCTARDGA